MLFRSVAGPAERGAKVDRETILQEVEEAKASMTPEKALDTFKREVNRRLELLSSGFPDVRYMGVALIW